MDRRDLLKTLGIGTAGALGLGTGQVAAGNHNSGNGNGRGNSGAQSFPKTTPYNGNRTATPDQVGNFDTVLVYLAEGVADFDNATGELADDIGIEGDFDTPAEFWHLGLQNRTVEEVKQNRMEAHRHWYDFFGIKFDAVEDLDDPVNDPAFGHDTDGNQIAREDSTFLHPGVGYNNYALSGNSVPNITDTGDALGSDWEGPTTNRDYRLAGKVRDGGFWILPPNTEGAPLDKLHTSTGGDGGELAPIDDGTKPKFWFNPRTGEKRTGGPGTDDKLNLSGNRADSAVYDQLPPRWGLFWGEYNISRGPGREPFRIHYESRFPTEFRPASGIIRTFACETMSRNAATDRNPRGFGRVHGTTYGSLLTNEAGDALPADGEGYQVGTIRNVMTYPPAYAGGREDYNDAPELPGPGTREDGDGIVYTGQAAFPNHDALPGAAPGSRT